MFGRDTFLGRVPVEKGTLAQGDINIEIHGPKKPTEEKMAKGSGDFTDCMSRIVPAMAKEGKSPSDPNAFCAWYEHNQSGHWPGEKSVGKRDAFLGGFGYEPSLDEILKAWSDAARAAALEARRHGGGGGMPGEGGASNPFSGASGDESTQGGAMTHQAAGHFGWEHQGPAEPGDDKMGTQMYSHPSSNTPIKVRPNGSWTHGAISGADDKSLTNYLTHVHGRTAA